MLNNSNLRKSNLSLFTDCKTYNQSKTYIKSVTVRNKGLFCSIACI